MSSGDVIHPSPLPSHLPPPPHAVIDLSQQYVKLDSIQSLISQYAPLYAAHGSGGAAQSPHQHQLLLHPLHGTSPLPTHVSFQSSAFNTSSALDLTVLQSLLSLLSPSLLSLDLSKSNITGRLFFRGKDVTLSLKEAEDARVFIEGRENAANGRSIVRDDDPPLLLEDADRRASFRYVSTAFNAQSRCFTRTYAELNWLHLREVNVSSSELSSHGLTTLLCCTGHSLQVLRMNDCRHVDNSGVFTLTALCRHLHTLEISNCPLLTEHALIALADLPQSCIGQLSLLACCQSHIRPGFFTALLNALQDRGFQGVMLVEGGAAGGASAVRHIRGVPSPLLARVVPGTIMDLTGAEVTQAVLKTLTAEQLQSFTARKQALVQRMTAEQQRVYANITSLPSSCPAPSCFYALDLSLHHYINDTLLLYILQAFGPSLYVLKLSHTFVTAAGLSSLSLCRNLRVLSLSSCHSLSDKQAANAAMMSCIRYMPELMELNISDSRLSGRMLSAHPLLCLFTFYAHACPISTRALRLLSESCASSLFILSLSHCPFINRRSIFYILRLQQLIVLDLSCCPALTGSDCLLLERYEGHDMRRLNIAGVDGVTPAVCRRIQEAITRTKQEAKGPAMPDSVEVIGEEGDGPQPTVVSSLSSPAMLSSASDFNYQLVTPQPPQPVQAAAQRRAEDDGRQFMRRDRSVEQEEEKVELDGRRYEGVQEDESGLYSVMDTIYAVAPSPASACPPPSVCVEPDDWQPQQKTAAASSSTTSRPSHAHSASFTSRPANPTPSRSQRSAAWTSGSSQSRPAARARHFPASQLPSASSSPAASPAAASTPSATAVTGGFLSHHQHHPHPAHQRPPHVSLPSSPMAEAYQSADSSSSRYSPMTEQDARNDASRQQQSGAVTWAAFTNHARARSTADLSPPHAAAAASAAEDGTSSSSSSSRSSSNGTGSAD